jgi:hypothetical protein
MTRVPRLIYQVKLDGLSGGDVIDVDGRMRAVLGSDFTCMPMTSVQVIVTHDKDARAAKRPGDEQISPANGHNADHSSDGSVYEKSGAVQIGKDASPTMFVSLIASAFRSCAAPGGRDKWHAAAADGFLQVNVRR